MTPSIAPPALEVLQQLLDDNAARFPEKAAVGPLTGDGGVRVFLPIVLGNPKPDSKAFAAGIATALRFRSNDDPTGEELVRDCMLWPPRPTWLEWRERWSAIDSTVARALARKIGSNIGVLVDPKQDEQPPEGMVIEGATAWRILAPPGQRIHMAIAPPDDVNWRLFIASVNKPDAKVLDLVRGMVEACVLASSMPLDQMLTRWPGLVVALLGTIAELAGNAAEVELGNW